MADRQNNLTRVLGAQFHGYMDESPNGAYEFGAVAEPMLPAYPVTGPAGPPALPGEGSAPGAHVVQVAPTLRLSKAQARVQFAQWLKDTFPDLYERALTQAIEHTAAASSAEPAASVHGFGQTSTSTPSLWDNLITGVTGLATAVLSYKQQQTVLQTNIDRAQAGLPPISVDTGAPVVKTQIDVSPEVAASLAQTAGAQTTKILWFAALGLGAWLLLK